MKRSKIGDGLRRLTWIMVAALLFAGCETADPAPTKEAEIQTPAVTVQPTEPPVTETMPTEPAPTEVMQKRGPGEEDGFVYSYPLGTTVSFDLNGDGIDEDITVQAKEYEDGLLTVGSTELEIIAIQPTGYFTIVNVDQNQKFLLVGVSDYGFSADDMTILYAYDGSEIAEVGYFEDLLGETGYNVTGAVCHGDGTISARVRMNVLGTWAASGLYRMGEAGLEDVTQLYYYLDWEGVDSGWEVTMNMELPMYTDSDQNSAQVTVPAETMVRMTAIKNGQWENTHWVCFEVDALDETLWLLTEEIDWITYVCNGEELLDSEEVFSGFGYAG